MSRAWALVVDDEPDIRELIEITLERMDVATTAVATLGDAYAAAGKSRFNLCLTDMRLPDGNGIDLIRHMHQHHPGVPVAMITAHGNMNSAIEALKAGAFDFVSKPVDLQVLRNLINTALRLGDRAATYGVGPKKMSEGYAYILPYDGWVNLGFYKGADLKDPKNLLDGTGAKMRHVKIRSIEDANRPSIRALVKEALKERRQALGR